MNARRPFLWAFVVAALLHGGLWFALKAPALPGTATAHRDGETLVELWDESDESDEAHSDDALTDDAVTDEAVADEAEADEAEAATDALEQPSLSEPVGGVLRGNAGATAEPHLGTGSRAPGRASGSGLLPANSMETRTSAVPRQTDTPQTSPGKDDKPGISLAQAGYGEPSPWVLPKQAATPATAEERLERNLAEGTMRHDYQRSMGIEGPIVAAINRAAWGRVPPRSKAHLSVTVDGTGQVVAIDVAETNSDMARYRELAAAALAALRSVKLRVPEGRRVVLTFQVESKVLMPSGSKPKRGVSLLGVPLGGDDGKHEPMVKILSPEFGVDKMKLPKPSNPDEDMELPTLKVGLNLLTMTPDLVDVGAVSRQVVHSKLVGQRVLQ